MGLLDRVVSADTLPPLISEGGRKPFPEEMGVLEGAPLFLSWITETWQTEKAALLAFSDEHNAFVPAEIKGFDVTTRRRLILEKPIVSEWLSGSNSFELTDSALYGNYLSAREAGVSGKLIGLACPMDKGIFALVLVLLDEEDKRSLDSNKLDILEEKETMERLRKSLFPDESGKRNNTDIQKKEDLLRRILTEGEGKILTKLTLEPLIAMASSLDPLKDEHDSKEEVISLFSSFFNERVTLLLDGSSHLYILQPVELFPGSALLKNQLLLGLGQLLGREVGEENLPMELLEKPANDKKELERFLALK